MNFMTKYYRSAKSALSGFVFVALFFSGLWALNSCEKMPTMIGNGILPDNIPVFSTDTFKIKSYTSYDSRIRTDALRMPFIGVYSDPYFGTTTMGFVTQLRLEEPFSELWKQFDLEEGVDWEVDSVRLVLRVTSNYGSNHNYKYLRISEISDMLYDDKEYYFDESVDTTGYGVSAIIPPLRSDTINNIRINLPPSFGRHLIRHTDSLFYTTEPDEKDFRDYFKGIYITIPSASAIEPLLLGFDFTYDSNNDYRNYIVVYLHDIENPETKTIYRFLLDSRKDNARFTTIKHDFSPLLQNVATEPLIDSLSYVQGLYGVYTTISIPGLETIKNDPNRARSAVNRARLIVPAHFESTYTDTTVAQRLVMRYVNKAGEKEIVPDYFIGNEYQGSYYDETLGMYVESSQFQSYFDGTLDTLKQKHVYNFNISNFVQNYFNDTQGNLKPELEIFLPANSVPNTILKANDSKSPLKFELTLTNY